MGAARAAFSAPTGRLGLGPVTSAGPVRVVCHSSHPRAETPPRRSSKTRAHQGPRTPRPLPRWLGEALLHWSPCFRRRDWRDEIAPIPSPLPSPAFGLRRLPLPAGGHRPGRPVVPTIRSFLPGRRGASRRARGPGRPRQHLAVGSAVRPGVRRGCQSPSARGGGSLARGRDQRQGRSNLALPVPGHRPVRPGHRRVRNREAA